MFDDIEDARSGSAGGNGSITTTLGTLRRHVVECATLLRLIITGVVVVLGGSFHFGYQISLINPLADVLQKFLESGLRENSNVKSLIDDESALRDTLWASVAGILFAGALLGAIVAPTLHESCGARRSFLLASMILCTSFSMAAAAKWLASPFTFIAARFLSGCGIGMITTIQTVYLTEISPVRYRGFMGTLTGFATSIGFVVASGAGLPQLFGSAELWHWAYILEMLPSLLLVASMVLFLAESPAYTLRRGDECEALRCIRLYHPRAECDARLAELCKEVRHHRRKKRPSDASAKRRPDDDDDDDGKDDSSFRAIISSRSSRNALLICTLLNATVSFSGILAVSFFGTFLLQGIGFSESGAAVANCFASVSGVLGNMAGSFTVDRVGRRILIIGGLSALAALNVLQMAFVFLFQSTEDVSLGYAFLAIFMLFLFAFSCGVGPMAWFLATELSSGASRPRIQALSVACQYATCFISPLLFFPIYQWAGPVSFLVFILPLCFTSAYLCRHLPETRGRGVEEIIAELGGDYHDDASPARKGAAPPPKRKSSSVYTIDTIIIDPERCKP